MGATTTIEWTDATWNPLWGCSVVSPGCRNCYAAGVASDAAKDAAEESPAEPEK